MYRRFIAFTVFIAIVLGSGILYAQGQFSIRAASADPVAGWQKMESGNTSVWVSPIPALTSADIERAVPNRGPDGRNTVQVVFTDTGAKKMRDLSAAQINKLIAMVLDGKVIFAPKIRSEIDKSAVLTGNSPNGLTLDEVQRILVSVNRSQK
jgi:preprotein translocase subunit SecD